MADQELLRALREAQESGEDAVLPDLREADLSWADLRGANLDRADLRGADLSWATLFRATLDRANLIEGNLDSANLDRANLRGANLRGANLFRANLFRANLEGANLIEGNLDGANLFQADLRGASLGGANLFRANLEGANLFRVNLRGANLHWANLRGASLIECDLEGASLLDADITNADLTGCSIYGVSAWGLKLSDETRQQNLLITRRGEPEITVDNIEVAQFVYLLLHNEKIRDVIDTIGKKGVLLLGRFTEGRITVLERLRVELRKRGYLPIVFNFDKPKTKDFTETVRLLAGLSHFVIADVTNPKSAPLELQASVPEIMVPFRPIIEAGEQPFAMLQDLWIKHREWVFEPIYYSSLEALVDALDEKIIKPAEQRFAQLLARKAERMQGEHV